MTTRSLKNLVIFTFSLLIASVSASPIDRVTHIRDEIERVVLGMRGINTQSLAEKLTQVAIVLSTEKDAERYGIFKMTLAQITDSVEMATATHDEIFFAWLDDNLSSKDNVKEITSATAVALEYVDCVIYGGDTPELSAYEYYLILGGLKPYGEFVKTLNHAGYVEIK